MPYLNTLDGGIVNEPCTIAHEFTHDGVQYRAVTTGSIKSPPLCVRAHCVTDDLVPLDAEYSEDFGWRVLPA